LLDDAWAGKADEGTRLGDVLARLCRLFTAEDVGARAV
jgi:hypothetical protein